MLRQNHNKSNSQATNFSNGYSATIYPLLDNSQYFELHKNGKFVDCGVSDDAISVVRDVREMYTAYKLGEQVTAAERKLFDSLAGLE